MKNYLILLIIATSCNSNISKEKNFDSILNCFKPNYDWDLSCFTPVDYGCTYYPEKGNVFGNLYIYMIPKEVPEIMFEEYTYDSVELYENKIGKLSVKALKSEFNIYIYIIPKKYLVKTPEGYWQKEKYKVELYTFNEGMNKWVLLDNIFINNSNGKNPNGKLEWQEVFIQKKSNELKKRHDNIIKEKKRKVEVRYDQLRDSLQRLNTQIPEKWQGVYSYLVSDEGLTAGGSSTSVWETFTVKQDSIISERQGYMADFIDNYLPAIKYPDTLYMYLDRCLNRDGKPKYYSSSLKPDVLYKKGDTFYLNDRKLDYRPLNE